MIKKDLKNLKNYKYLETMLDLNSKRTSQFTYLVLTIIALIFFGLFAINPTLSTIAGLQKQLSDSKFVDAQLQRKINALTSLQAEYNNLGQDLEIIDEAIPSAPKAPILLAQLQAVGEASGVNVVSTQIFPVQIDSKTKKPVRYGTFNFSLLAQGQQQQVDTFIENLAQMQRVISIDQIGLSRKADDPTQLQISIRGAAFFLE